MSQLFAKLCQIQSTLNSGGTDYEYKVISSECFRETATPGNIWTRTICIPFIDGVAQPAVVYWIDENAGTASTTAPVAPVERCPSEVGDDPEFICLCDISAAGISTPFLRRLTVDATTGGVSISDTELDGSTPYTPTGVVSKCPVVQTDRATTQHINELVGAVVWTRPNTEVVSVSLTVLRGTVTVTDADGAITTIYAGESVGWEGTPFLRGGFTITGSAGSLAHVVWSEMTTI